MSTAQQSFLGLFLANQPQLYAFLLARGVRPGEVDDVLQEVATVLWRKFDDFEFGSNFRAWAFQVARLEILKEHERRQRANRLAPLELQEESLLAIEASLIEDKRDYRHLHQCLADLGSHSRELIDMHYQQGYSFDSMAERLGVSAGALRTRLCRIRKALATCLQQKTGLETGLENSDAN